MKQFFRGHILICFGVFVLILSLLSGVVAYHMTTRIRDEGAGVYALPWSMPLTSDYDELHAGARPGEFLASVYDEDADAEASTEYTLNARGKVLRKKNLSHRTKVNAKVYQTYDEKTSCYGLADKEGNTILPAEFDAMDFFGADYGVAEKDGIKILLNADGKTLFRGEIGDEIYSITATQFFIHAHDNAVFDCTTGKTTPVDNRYDFIWSTEEGAYYAEVENNKVFLDEEFLPEGDGQMYRNFGLRRQGLRYVEKLKDVRYSAGKIPEKTTIEKGYANDEGDIVLPLPKDTLYGFYFAEDKAIVINYNTLSVYDIQGNKLFSHKGNFRDVYPPDIASKDASVMHYAGGYAPVTLECSDFEDFGGAKFGLLDTKGRFVLDPVFDRLFHGGAGYLIAEYKYAYGILDTREEI